MLKHWLIFLLFPFIISAQSYPSKPVNYVTDETGTLSAEEQITLNRKLRAFEDSTSNQIFVYLTESLNGQDMESLSQEIFHNWKIGKEGKNNGVLIAIFLNDHKFRIHTGYGLEGALPDVLTKRIQDENMRPHFKQGTYFEGINEGLDKLIYYSGHEYKNETNEGFTDYWQSWVIGYGFNVLFLIWYCYNVLRKNPKRKKQTSSFTKFIFIGIACIAALIPCFGGIVLFFMVIASSNFKFTSAGSTYSGDSTSSWSSSDSSWSSSDSSSSSDFGGGSGGDSGGGGSSSDW